jgi:hypothetical protein
LFGTVRGGGDVVGETIGGVVGRTGPVGVVAVGVVAGGVVTGVGSGV